MQKIRRQVVAKENNAQNNESSAANQSQTGLTFGRIFKKTINVNRLPNSQNYKIHSHVSEKAVKCNA